MSVTGMEIEIMGAMGAVITAMLILYLTHTGNKYLDTREKNKRFSMWMKYLQIDTDIDKCVNSFEEIISQESWPKVNEIIAYFGIFLPFIIIKIANNFDKDQLEHFVNISWGFIIIPIVFFAILSYRVNKINQTNILVKARRTEIRIIIIKFFIFNFILITMLILVIQLQQNRTLSDVKIIEESLYGLGVVLIGSMVFIKIIHRDFIDKVKTLLNTDHMANYPFIHITTKEAYFEGKMQDVFDSNLLILEDNGKKTIVEWNEITTMKLKEASLIDNSSPPPSQENS